MRVKERHATGAFVDVKGDSEEMVIKFVQRWRNQVDRFALKTSGASGTSGAREEHEVQSEIGFRP